MGNNDQKAIEQEKEEIERWLVNGAYKRNKDGSRSSLGYVRICRDADMRSELREFLRDMAFFPLVEIGLRLIYIYRQEDQPEGLRNMDGISWKRDRWSKPARFAIGISEKALRQGGEYTQLVFLHELAHVTHGGDHTEAFHEHLNRLIATFNEKTGSKLENDYYGLEAP